MQTSDFNFDLPEELIAQTPLPQRDHSRLLYMERQSGVLHHKHFYDLPNLLQPGDLLVLNDSRVLPARLFGEKLPDGGSMQFLLLTQKSADTWEVLVKPGRRAKVGSRFTFGDGRLVAKVQEIIEGGNRIVTFDYTGNFFTLLEEIGQMPLPEYIHTALSEKERYQTVYAKHDGSAAAPTAGLHFTGELLAMLNQRGIDHTFVTLHVGLGTFRPVKATRIEDHEMHFEQYSISPESAAKMTQTKARGGRIIAVGTTACRTLESVVQQTGKIQAQTGSTGIFIYPGYTFRAIDGLITNFHLPMSTLVMLVSAFAGRENTLHAYHAAIAERYRFYSFGDAMLIL